MFFSSCPALQNEETVGLRVAVKIKRQIHVLKNWLKESTKIWNIFSLVLFLAPFGQCCLLTKDISIKFKAEIVLM